MLSPARVARRFLNREAGAFDPLDVLQGLRSVEWDRKAYFRLLLPYLQKKAREFGFDGCEGKLVYDKLEVLLTKDGKTGKFVLIVDPGQGGRGYGDRGVGPSLWADVFVSPTRAKRTDAIPVYAFHHGLLFNEMKTVMARQP